MDWIWYIDECGACTFEAAPVGSQLPWWKGAKLLSRPVWVGFWWTWNPHAVLDTLLEVELACFQQTSGRDFIPWWKWSLHASSALRLRILFLDRSRACILPAHFWQGLKTLMVVVLTCGKCTCGLDLISWWMWTCTSGAVPVGVSYLDGREPNCFPGQFELVFDGHGTHILYLTPY